VNQIIDRSKTSYLNAGSAYSRNAALYLMVALVFVVWGVSEFTTRPLLGWLMALLGIVFLIGAFLSYSTGREYLQSGPDKRK
jgi:Flp pilus assembly protein TadB